MTFVTSCFGGNFNLLNQEYIGQTPCIILYYLNSFVCLVCNQVLKRYNGLAFFFFLTSNNNLRSHKIPDIGVYIRSLYPHFCLFFWGRVFLSYSFDLLQGHMIKITDFSDFKLV